MAVALWWVVFDCSFGFKMQSFFGLNDVGRMKCDAVVLWVVILMKPHYRFEAFFGFFFDFQLQLEKESPRFSME